MTKIDRVVVASMSKTDLARAIDWAADEGWDPGLSDAECFWSADPEGFLAARVDGELVGSVSAVRYGPSFGFIGLFIVRPEWRAQGIGSQLWSAAVDRLSGRSVGLDGVVTMQASYARSGFVLAHRNLRYTGSLASAVGGTGAHRLDATSIDAVEEYDLHQFGSRRREFLLAWLAQPGATTVGEERAGRLGGYGTIRRSRHGFKIGPLFADDADIARTIVAALREAVPADAVVSLDVPESNAAAVNIAVGLGMTVSFETARMYAGSDPGLATDRVFGVTTFELG